MKSSPVFSYLTNQKKLARPTATIALCGIKFFYQQTLKQEWPTLRFVRPAAEHKLPVILSRDEVRRVLAAVRSPTLELLRAHWRKPLLGMAHLKNTCLVP